MCSSSEADAVVLTHLGSWPAVEAIFAAAGVVYVLVQQA